MKVYQGDFDLVRCSRVLRASPDAGNDDLSSKYWLYKKRNRKTKNCCFFAMGERLGDFPIRKQRFEKEFSRSQLGRAGQAWQVWARQAWRAGR